MNDIEMGSSLSLEKKPASVAGIVVGEIVKKATGHLGALIERSEIGPQKSRVKEKSSKPHAPDKKPERDRFEKDVVFEAVARPESSSGALVPENIQALRDHIEGLAVERYKKPFRELPIHQKLELLGDQIRETDGENSKTLQQSLRRLEQILHENSSPKQWQDLQEVFAQMPNFFDLPVTEQSVLFEVQNTVFSHVSKNENLKGYGLVPDDLDDVSEAIGWTGSGQRPRGPRARGAGRGGRGAPPPGPPLTPNQEWDDLRRGYDRVLAFDEEASRIKNTLNTTEITEKITDLRLHIRYVLSTLERTREERGWSTEGISPEEQSLSTSLRLIHLLDAGEFQKMQHEERIRNWLHRTSIIAKRGANPQDMEVFVKMVQDLDDAELLDVLTRLPGVWRAFQLLERNGVAIMTNEHHPNELKRIINGIEGEMTQFFRNNPDLASEGISVETAIELGRRFWKVSGREGAFYRRYMIDKEMVHYGERPEDDYIAADANLTWDLYRIIYYPHAIWKFFEIGGVPGGETKVVRVRRMQNIFGSGTVPVDEKVKAGNGAGRDVRKTLVEDKFDLHIGDLFSRRLESYAFPGWIEQRYDQTNIANLQNPAMQTTLLAEKAFLDAHSEQTIKTERDPRRRDALREELKTFMDMRKAEYLTQYNIEKVGEFVTTLEDTPVEAFKFASMRRGHEAARSNVRDTKAAMGVLTTVWDFIQNPTPTNYFKLGGVTAYSSLANGQEGVYGPAYDALVKVNKGELFLGMGIFDKEVKLGPLKLGGWNSIARKVYGWENLESWDLRKIRREAIISGHLSKNQVDALEGAFGRLTRLFDHGVDPVLLTILALGLIQGEIEQTAKELKE